jgi:uncharacterized protein (TIGR02246 family)
MRRVRALCAAPTAFLPLLLPACAAQQHGTGRVPTVEAAVSALLADWHHAAATGDFKAYFSSMTDDAIFLGTDASERWTRAEFEAFARPYFDGVEAWTYTPVQTHVTASPSAGIAWFDQILRNEKYGLCRGTGVARLEPDARWRVAHYSLTFLVPNEVAKEVTDLTRGFELSRPGHDAGGSGER